MIQKAVVFSGYSSSGKTTLICSLIEHYSQRGILVGAIKHTHHPLPETGGGDTGRFLLAGAHQAILAGKGKALLFHASSRASGPEPFSWANPSDLPQRLETPLILIEGFKNAGVWPKVLVAAPGKRLPPPDPTVIAIAGGNWRPSEVPSFERDDVPGLAGFLDRILQ